MEIDTEDGKIDPEDYDLVNGETIFKGKYKAHLDCECADDCPYCERISSSKLET